MTNPNRFSVARPGKRAIVGAAGLLGGVAMLLAVGPAMAEKGKTMERHKAHLEELDTNKDGKISRDEVKAAHDARFNSVDTDGNGSVSLEEFQAAEERRKQMRLQRKFERADKNGDGVLTSDELDSRRDGHFDKIDKNGDGEISAKERKAAHKMMGKHRGHSMRDMHDMHDMNESDED